MPAHAPIAAPKSIDGGPVEDPPRALKPQRERSRGRGQPAVLAALGANCGIFALWHLQRRWQLQGRPEHAPLLQLLNGHALCSLQHLRSGRLHTLLTSSLSHQRFLHFLVNSYGLSVFGAVAAKTLSVAELGGLLALCGTSSSAAHVLCHPGTPVLGASGMLMGLVVVGGSLAPDHRFHMVLPVPGMSLSMLQVADLTCAVNLAGFLARRRYLGSVAWAAHLGGAGAGLLVSVAAAARNDARFADPWAVRVAQTGDDWLRTAISLDEGMDSLHEKFDRLRGGWSSR